MTVLKAPFLAPAVALLLGSTIALPSPNSLEAESEALEVPTPTKNFPTAIVPRQTEHTTFDPNVQCFPTTGLGTTTDMGAFYDLASSFCAQPVIEAGAVINRYDGIRVEYPAEEGLKIRFAIENSFCDTMYIDIIECQDNFGQTFLQCGQHPATPLWKAYGGSYQTLGCGYCFIEILSTDSPREEAPIARLDVSASVSDLEIRDDGGDKLTCNHSTDPGYDYADAPSVAGYIDGFCTAKDGVTVPIHKSAYEGPFALASGASISLSITNLWCEDPVPIIKDGCTALLGRVENECWTGTAPLKSYGGSYNGGCGFFTIQVNAPSSQARDAAPSTDLEFRDDALTCLPSSDAGYPYADEGAIETTVDSFCNEKDGFRIPKLGAATGPTYILSGGVTFHLLISNIRCSDPAPLTKEGCSAGFGHIMQNCYTATVPLKNYGGLYNWECGYYIIQPFAASTKARSVDGADS
ncbi:Hypothetical predicted protein [Lecanosticta acicola]|uniref:Uncharacterized protein n=1 Tax=Lecanosticta acicola TaxID=111012 RepID=A0AAI8YT08_9PEZI|nr:Hypothetical predicted protein [Lecanosticta acicola]